MRGILDFDPVLDSPIKHPLIEGVFYWWAIKDSNLGPTGYEPVALTN